jgi:hypothetical protein
MKQLPNTPFTTKDFSPEGGGIDFLGLRWVNLTIVGQYLIPGLNNVTQDMGTYFLAAWIPWKFRQLCRSEHDYTEKNYITFREKIEVALSLTFRNEAGLDRPHGPVRNRVGNRQSCSLPTSLSFKSAGRNASNSLYAAAIYGPSIQYLGLISSYRSMARSGRLPLNIPIVGEDADTETIIKCVDACLARSTSYPLLASLDSPEFGWNDICTLAEAGLDPAWYRAAEHAPLKTSFVRKLLPEDAGSSGFARTLSARLVLATLQQRTCISTQELRDAWYTGMFSDGTLLSIEDRQLDDQRKRWALFMARQYQRYAIELFLLCFEEALLNDCRSVDEVVDYWTSQANFGDLLVSGTFRDVLKTCAGRLYRNDDVLCSQAWNAEVHQGDERFEYVAAPQDNGAIGSGLRMLAGWYWRMLVRQQSGGMKELLELGGADRIGMAWFLQWLRVRQDKPIRELLKDIFCQLVFAQHMRIALARFDGAAQRLRFLLGDSGIEPSTSVGNLGQLRLQWMPDRLDTLTFLLCDCDVLNADEGSLNLGPRGSDLGRTYK